MIVININEFREHGKTPLFGVRIHLESADRHHATRAENTLLNIRFCNVA
ncbi:MULTISPECIES: hypothetical protein [Rahnella]|nr:MULTISPECIES: hypothetical protein [Rahnella]MBF7995169.1 hypothetical protein [Rahnella laticis]MBV6819984.1 hypothetical protein [Rahnella sp. PD12R]